MKRPVDVENPVVTKFFQILNNFKTEECNRTECPFYSKTAKPFSDIRKCFNYHSEEDRRRMVFNVKGKTVNMHYTKFMKEIDPNGCLNDIEYEYHPHNFKTIPCPIKEKKCNNLMCPNYHSDEEKDTAEIMRSSFISRTVFSKIGRQMRKIINLPEKLDKKFQTILNEYNHVVKEKPVVQKPPKRPSYSAQKMVVNHIPSEKGTSDFLVGQTLRTKHHYGKKDKNWPLVENKPNKTTYYYDQEVKMFEDIYHEFKNFTKLEVRTIVNYVCGFLNTLGGSLFFGINDNGFVKGMTLLRADIDAFQISMDGALRHFHPEIFPDQIQIHFHEVCSDKTMKKLIANK